MNKHPAVGWGVAGAILLLAVVVYVVNRPRSETNELAEMVTIRCSETGREWQMTRGAMEKELMLRPYPVNPEQGLINTETGRPTGFPVDAWNKTVQRINAERSALAEKDRKKYPEKHK
ncbi:MAG: hypothetical protein AB7G11_17465 [Phycisphaerales bacterium]